MMIRSKELQDTITQLKSQLDNVQESAESWERRATFLEKNRDEWVQAEARTSRGRNYWKERAQQAEEKLKHETKYYNSYFKANEKSFRNSYFRALDLLVRQEELNFQLKKELKELKEDFRGECK